MVEKLQPPAVLVIGESGSGKTDSLATYLEAGIETFVLITEPGGVESLLDSVRRRNLDINKLHWTTKLPARAKWTALEQMANVIGTQDYEAISKIKTGIAKEETRPVTMEFLNAIKNFHCERTGQDFGDVTLWDDTRAFCIDSLSGWNLIAWNATVGFKPTAHQGEWNIAMNFILALLHKVLSDRSCHFALTAHVEKEISELTGVNQVMVSTLGRKIAPQIPRFFSDMVYAKRALNPQNNSASFTWATIDLQAALKNRNLTIGTALPPSFVPVVEAYRKRKTFAAQSSPAAQVVPALATQQGA